MPAAERATAQEPLRISILRRNGRTAVTEMARRTFRDSQGSAG